MNFCYIRRFIHVLNLPKNRLIYEYNTINAEKLASEAYKRLIIPLRQFTVCFLKLNADILSRFKPDFFIG